MVTKRKPLTAAERYTALLREYPASEADSELPPGDVYALVSQYGTSAEYWVTTHRSKQEAALQLAIDLDSIRDHGYEPLFLMDLRTGEQFEPQYVVKWRPS